MGVRGECPIGYTKISLRYKIVRGSLRLTAIKLQITNCFSNLLEFSCLSQLCSSGIATIYRETCGLFVSSCCCYCCYCLCTCPEYIFHIPRTALSLSFSFSPICLCTRLIFHCMNKFKTAVEFVYVCVSVCVCVKLTCLLCCPRCCCCCSFSSCPRWLGLLYLFFAACVWAVCVWAVCVRVWVWVCVSVSVVFAPSIW